MSDVSLGTIGLAVATWLAGFLSATTLDWRRNVQRRRGVALALREEVRRIRQELGPQGGFSDVQIAGAASVIPRVHPWVHSILPEAANIEPRVFALFLELDRVLNNMSTFQGQTRKLRDLLDQVGPREPEITPRARAGEEPPDAVAIDRVVRQLEERFRVKRERAEIKLGIESAVNIFDGAQARARRILDEIERLLETYIDRSKWAG